MTGGILHAERVVRRRERDTAARPATTRGYGDASGGRGAGDDEPSPAHGVAIPPVAAAGSSGSATAGTEARDAAGPSSMPIDDSQRRRFR